LLKNLFHIHTTDGVLSSGYRHQQCKLWYTDHWAPCHNSTHLYWASVQ